jgi:hypothetical protein
MAGTLQIRRFLASAGEPRHIALVELSRPPNALASLGRLYRDYAA